MKGTNGSKDAIQARACGRNQAWLRQRRADCNSNAIGIVETRRKAEAEKLLQHSRSSLRSMPVG